MKSENCTFAFTIDYWWTHDRRLDLVRILLGHSKNDFVNVTMSCIIGHRSKLIDAIPIVVHFVSTFAQISFS